jgi:hypothetical protein
MYLLLCNFQLQETEKYKVGMLQMKMINTYVIKICLGVDMANYADEEACLSSIFIY